MNLRMSLAVLVLWTAGANLAAGLNLAAGANTLVADATDSIRVTHLLDQTVSLSNEENKILFFAKGFLGTPYKAGTLETFPFEHLVVRTDSVDCTTFVEYVLALYLTDQRLRTVNETSDAAHTTSDAVHETLDAAHKASEAARRASDAPYTLFRQFLQTIRYRDGHIEGYPSRLHYFSDWIADNERKGIVREITRQSPYEVRQFDLNFMSHHASSYPFLANDTASVRKMQTIESRWSNYHMPYIPKARLGAGRDTLRISDGDILAIATNLSGLDVVHVGFACWIDGKLHLLHASSAKKKVLLDPLTLHEYTRTKRPHIGIRVIHVCR